jgi:hypothetical protein
MKERLKWIVAGLGFIAGVQLITSLMLVGLAKMFELWPAAYIEWQFMLVIYGLTLGAFMVGGFVIGRVNREPRFIDAFITAIAMLAITSVIHVLVPEGQRYQFTGSIWITGAGSFPAFSWWSWLFAVPALAASFTGAYLGYLMTIPLESAHERFLELVGVFSSVVAPITALFIAAIAMPWYVFVVVTLTVFIALSVGYWRFAHNPLDTEEISISPEHQRGHS